MLLAARLYPLPAPERLPSDAVALPNGGREEIFFIRIPDDRIGNPRAAAVAPFPRQAFVREGEERILAELFRVRNKDGRVIGLASKMSGNVLVGQNRSRENVDWMLMIPGRGGLMMSTQGRPAGERTYPLSYMGLDPSNAGVIVEGTDQFAGLTGFFVEETQIESRDDNDQAVGVLSLRTRMQGITP